MKPGKAAIFIAAVLALFTFACGTTEVAPTPTTAPPKTSPVETATPLPPSTTQPVSAPTAAPTATLTAAPKPVATATPPPKESKPKGTLIMTMDRIGAPSFDPFVRPYPQLINVEVFGLTERLQRNGYKGVYVNEPWLARSWELNGLQLDVFINKGIFWHGDWGEFTAQDVKYSWDRQRAEGSIESAIAHWKFVKNVEIVNDYQIRLTWKEPYAFWDEPLNARMSSKAVADKLGPGVANTTPVGTGPFRAIKWDAGDILEAEAVVPHWYETPKVAKLQVLEVPEAATRVAMMLTGEAHIADVPFEDIRRIVDAGGKTYEIGIGVHQLIGFAGNYWQKTDHEGKPLGPRPGFDTTRPWIGDPGNPDSMEKARKVRWAMSMAIDRKSIADTILVGLGKPEHTPYGVYDTPGRPLPEKYRIPYDPVKAKQNLSDAGYPNGFEVTWSIPEGVARINVEVAEAYVSFWEAIGLTVKAKRIAYTAFRPDLVSRTAKDPWAWGREAPYRLDGTFEASATTLSAFILGYENDKGLELYKAGQAETDPVKRTRLHEEYAEYNHHWQLLASTVWSPKLYLAGPAVASWKPWLWATAWPNRLDTVVLK